MSWTIGILEPWASEFSSGIRPEIWEGGASLNAVGTFEGLPGSSNSKREMAGEMGGRKKGVWGRRGEGESPMGLRPQGGASHFIRGSQ